MNKKILLLLVLSISLLLVACNQNNTSNEALAYEDNFEVIGKDKEKLMSDVSDTIYDTSDRTNQHAEEASTYLEDPHAQLQVPEGRYEITGRVTGNVNVYDEEGKLLIHNIVGSQYGAQSLTVDLTEDHTIKFDGFIQVFVTPTETEMSNELTVGIWEVGLDIEAGNYDVTAPSGIGYLQLFDPNGENKAYEIIGGEYASTQGQVTLKEGQKVKITGVPMIQFEPNN